jgi:plastocyanin
MSPALPAGAIAQSFTVKVDGAPPTGSPWAFLRFFPGTSLKVHTGDVVDFAWAGTDTPHTVTLVPSDDPEGWRTDNQAPKSGVYATPIPDKSTGGDDGDLVENPAVVAPTDPTCGKSEGTACAFDGTTLVSSGLQFSNPTAQPSFFASVSAPVGTYSFLCLLHPGMQTLLKVVDESRSIPTPDDVSAKAKKQLKRAIKVDGKAAELQAQTVTTGGGVKRDVTGPESTTWAVSAGGFSNGVSVNEFPSDPIVVHRGDQIAFTGTDEIHTATFPKSSFTTTPFIVTDCEQPGDDLPATSPSDCTDPSLFELVLNATAITPTTSNKLNEPDTFRNTGLLVIPQSFTFVARQPGRYTFICLIHGPEMSGVIRVR